MLESGRVLGERYEIIQQIGVGGMSFVYLAKCNKLQRNVAIKVLKEEFATDEEFVKKFRAEALAAASLSHPNVVGIYDVVIDDTLKYIVMEYIEGETLKEYLKKHGAFTSEQTIEFGLQMVSAVRHAHKKQIIHRDIKPQNIMITHEDILKVADFGIARAVDSSTIVATGNAIGSVHYFSPEQAKGKYVNETSDLYACGIVLFELVTNHLPFVADSHVSIALKQISEELPLPSSYVENMSKGLEQLIIKATMKNQEDRYQTADEMLEDMKELLINPNRIVLQQEEVPQHTILLTAEETEYLRNNSKQEAVVQRELPNEEDEEDNDYVSPFYKFLVGAGAFFITIIIMIGIIFAWFFWQPLKEGPEAVAMPQITGMTVEEAEQVLIDMDVALNITVVDEEMNEAMENGEISKQNPTERTIITPGTQVQVILVNNPVIEMSEVIDVIGLDSGEAQRQLMDLGFVVGIERLYSDTLAMGKVMSQEPSRGTVLEEGAIVTLTISKGPQSVKVRVPNLEGMSEEQAKISLRNHGLSLGRVTYQTHESMETGKVFAQSIGVGMEIEQGDMVSITVSTGKEIEEEEIEEEQADEQLQPEDENQLEDEVMAQPEDEEGTTSEENTETELEDDTEGDIADQESEDNIEDDIVNQDLEDNTEDETTDVGTSTVREHTIYPIDNMSKDAYHILVMLETNEYTGVVFDEVISTQDLPITIGVSGRGTGTLITYFDSQEAYRDNINFNEVTQ